MALNFPDSPTLNQVYTDTTSGFSYQWDGVVWQSYTASASKNISIVDNIESSFNGSTQTFALAVSGVSFTPANAQQLRVVLGGIVQEPVTNYTVSGPNITFIIAPIAGLDCSIVSLGPAVPVNVPGDGTVTPAKLSTGGPSWNTGGDVVITGTGTTALLVNGNARVTGILTVSSTVTLNSGGVNVLGVVTATSFRGANVARGGGNDLVFYENDQEVTVDYTISTSKNAMSAGPVGIATGITVTIPSGSAWTIV